MMATAMAPVSLEETSLASTEHRNSTLLDSEFRYKLFSASYGIIFILGLIANCYVLFVLRRLREAKAIGEMRIYMTNLSIADLLFVCVLPLWVGYYSHNGNWMYSDILCRLTGSMFFINTYCSILFLGAISINRYRAVTRPLDVASSDHWRRGVAVTVTIWLVTIGIATPNLLYPATSRDGEVTRCFEGYHNKDDSEKRRVAAMHFAIIAMFFVIFFLVVVCNLLIARVLLTQSPSQSVRRSEPTMSRSKSIISRFSISARPRGVKRQALQMLCVVVGVFTVCFLPHHIIQGPWVLAVLEIKEGWGRVSWGMDTRQGLNDAHQISLLLMGLNCIVDPVVYCFATRKFRAFIFAHIRKVVKGEACSHTMTSQMSMDSKNQSQKLHSENPQLQ